MITHMKVINNEKLSSIWDETKNTLQTDHNHLNEIILTQYDKNDDDDDDDGDDYHKQTYQTHLKRNHLNPIWQEWWWSWS